MRAVHGAGADWTVTDHLLAGVIDVLQWANYQRSDTKKSTKPQPIPRPGMPDAAAARRTELSPDELYARLKAQRDARR